MPKRILLLSYFYPPDLSAGSFRSAALVKALRIQGGAQLQLDVVTTQPNRYQNPHQNSSNILILSTSIPRITVNRPKSSLARVLPTSREAKSRLGQQA
jgi:hypothetical protein